jgi:pyruvate/2-oxoglutarate dehydrogenase complex dihydrolipoamide dehydrogenase (E3) component
MRRRTVNWGRGCIYFSATHPECMTSHGGFQYDLAIIGGGSGGYAAARTAAEAGLRVVVIEGGDEVGGLCILRGCMPTKAMLYAADVLHLARMGKTWGLRIPKPKFNWTAVMARKNAMVDDFARYRREQLVSGKFKFIRARAHFIDPHTLALNIDAKASGPKPNLVPHTLTAKNFIISTGSITAPSPLPHLLETGFLTSDDALQLKKLPRSLIVLGGGPIAVEFAQFFSRFGVQVTLIQRGEHLLRDFDTDAALELQKVFRREDITLFSNTKLIDAFREGHTKGISFQFDNQTTRVTAEEILFALGRIPNTAELDLQNAGVTTEYGRIVTNSEMQSSASHIYAAGDCTGPYEIVHIAIEQGEIAAHNIAHPHKKRRIDYRLLTSVTFTDPQVASVGLTEKEACAKSIPFLTACYPFSDHGKSLIMEAKDGFVKLLADPQSGEILGGTCVGPMGGELIHEIIAAMHKRMTVQELAAMPHYHPTLAEIWTYPAAELAERISS